MDAREITAQLQADPALAAVLRGVLLSEDLLHLPGAMAELAERQARTEERLAELAERMDQLAERMAQLADQMALLAERQARTEERLERVIDDLGKVKGLEFEIHIRSQPRRYLRKLVAGPRLLDDDALSSLEHELADHGASPALVDDLLRADIIAEADLRSPLEGRVGLVIEASWRLSTGDVAGARRRATTLAMAGRPALAVVIGRESPLPVVLEQARDEDVAVVADQDVMEAGHPVS